MTESYMKTARNETIMWNTVFTRYFKKLSIRKKLVKRKQKAMNQSDYNVLVD